MLLVYRELHSLSVKDVALLEDAQLIFLIFNTFVCAFGWVDGRLDAVRVNKNHWQMYGKLEKNRCSTSTRSYAVGKYNGDLCSLSRAWD